MLFAAMPLKVIKNQEFCMDFCIFPEKDWETGAKMLSFKSQESIRGFKTSADGAANKGCAAHFI